MAVCGAAPGNFTPSRSRLFDAPTSLIGPFFQFAAAQRCGGFGGEPDVRPLTANIAVPAPEQTCTGPVGASDDWHFAFTAVSLTAPLEDR